MEMENRPRQQFEPDGGLDAILAHLETSNYVFICPSPESQGRVVQRLQGRRAQNLVDVFGWNLPVDRNTLESLLGQHTLCKAMNFFSMISDLYQAKIRISNLYMDNGAKLYYVHSAFPTTQDSVFFGPDTYLYLDFLKCVRSIPKTVVDVCCGAGAGAIHISRQFPKAKVIGLDLNTRALDLAKVNARHAGVEVRFEKSDLLDKSPDEVDLIISNPPYIASADGVALYADGGVTGLELALRIVRDGLKKLARGGLLMIYTGVGVPLSGKDPFLEQLGGLEVLDYRIIHPDMWPEEIGKGAYVDVGRIQVVGTIIRRS